MAGLERQLNAIRSAAQQQRFLTTEKKRQILRRLAEDILQHSNQILSANSKDLRALSKSTSSAFRDRLELNEKRLKAMSESLQKVAELPDPVGEIVEERRLSNGLQLQKIRAPLGLIFMIFESRPNVITEAFSLAFMAGNALILKSGSESRHSSKVLYDMIESVLKESGVRPSPLLGLAGVERKIVQGLLRRNDIIDLVVPRGGEALIHFVCRNSTIPVIKNDRGLCHTFVDREANLEMAIEIVNNAKTQRPGVCNALETVLVHEQIAEIFIPQLYEKTKASNLEWYVDAKAKKLLKGKDRVRLASAENWDTEYLDLKMNCAVVPSIEAAIDHIEMHGSRHSEAIVTESGAAANLFLERVDAAAVYWNASTRFTDGFEFGLGGELGISTQKLHVRGPVGLRELTSVRWVIRGQGQVRS